MNPIVKVICGEKSKSTLVTKGTNNPYFDEVSVQSVRALSVCVLIPTVVLL